MSAVLKRQCGRYGEVNVTSETFDYTLAAETSTIQDSL